MRGHDQLIALRRRGLRPSLVLLHVLPAYSPMSAQWQSGGHRGNGVAHVELLEAEPMARLDLRFLVGLSVIVAALPDAAKRLHAACVKAGADWVVSCGVELHGEELRTVEQHVHQGVSHG